MIKKNLFLAALLMMLGATETSAQKYVGGDISLLPTYEAKNAVYKDKNGNTISDVLLFMKEQGCNAMRVRLFVDPSKAPETHKKEGVLQDLEYVKALGKRIKDAGLYFLLDFHYSDTWTDPGKHSTPDAWKNMTTTELAAQMYSYTKECLDALNNFGATPDAIQVGNEVNIGQLWDTGKTWPSSPSSQTMQNFISYVNNAVAACREMCPQAKVVFHVAMNYRGSSASSNNNDQAKNWVNVLKDKGVDYDIFGLSYYPYYHGPLNELESLLTYLETAIPDKEIQLVEAGYPNAWYPSGATYDYTSVYDDTEEGQRQFTADLIEKLNAHPQVNGLYWWYPEANGNYFASSWYNMGLWNNSTHCALKALYELKNFISDPSGIVEVTNSKQSAGQDVCYDLLGRRIQLSGCSPLAHPSPLKKGIYVADGQLVVMK